jgi:hypothetical protein
MVDGDGEEFAILDDLQRKETMKLSRFLAPLDACFCKDALRVEAHLLDLLTDAGRLHSSGSSSAPAVTVWWWREIESE